MSSIIKNEKRNLNGNMEEYSAEFYGNKTDALHFAVTLFSDEDIELDRIIWDVMWSDIDSFDGGSFEDKNDFLDKWESLLDEDVASIDTKGTYKGHPVSICISISEFESYCDYCCEILEGEDSFTFEIKYEDEIDIKELMHSTLVRFRYEFLLDEEIPDEPSDDIIDLHPRFVINTDAFLSEWKEGWNEVGYESEDWKLVATPVWPDRKLALLFEMRDKVYTGKIVEGNFNTQSHYRVLIFDISEELRVLKLVEKLRFKAQNAHVHNIFFQNGALKAVVTALGRNSYSVIHVWPGADDDAQYKLHSGVSMTLPDSKGNLYVGYRDLVFDGEKRIPVACFNSDGESKGYAAMKLPIACWAMNLDCDERIWWSSYPSNGLNTINDKGEIDLIPVVYQGCAGFGFSRDRKYLFAAYTEEPYVCQLLRFELDDDGCYGNPVALRFNRYADYELDPDVECAVTEWPVFMKDMMLLNHNGEIYVFDLNRCCSRNVRIGMIDDIDLIDEDKEVISMMEDNVGQNVVVTLKDGTEISGHVYDYLDQYDNVDDGVPYSSICLEIGDETCEILSKDIETIRIVEDRTDESIEETEE